MINKDVIKDFDAVGFMRQTRDKISKEISDLSKEQILMYFIKHRPKERILPNAKH
jgi:hypothetical protein